MNPSTRLTEDTTEMRADRGATIASVLNAASRSLASNSGEDARIEAEALFSHSLRADRTHLLARLTDSVPPESVRAFEALLRRRLAREPLAYIVGRCEFYGVEI